MANICAHVYVSGDVQGVGFRYSAIRQAKNLGVTGWVRNLRDGRLEVLIEGEESDVHQMIAWCRHGPRGAEVMDIQTDIRPYTASFQDFEVMF